MDLGKPAKMQFKYRRAPNGRKALRISYYDDPYIGYIIDRIALVNTKREVLFEPKVLTAASMVCAWSPNSRYCVIGAQHRRELLYLVLDTKESTFAFIPMKALYPLEVTFLSSSGLKIQAHAVTLNAMNSTVTFGAGPAQFPCKRYKSETPLMFKLSELSFRDMADLNRLGALLKRKKKYSLAILRDGFHPFSGKPPVSTTQKFNTRQMEVFHLELFAEYGDATAKAWLREVKRLSNGKFSRCDKVTKYLGRRTSKAPKDAQ